MLRLILITTILLAVGAPLASAEKARSFEVVNHLSGWYLDSDGYHPAVFLWVANSSGHSLTNKPIQFKARFTDLQTGDLTTGMKYLRQRLEVNQSIFVPIIGKHVVELPLQTWMWPPFDIKVMCKVGNVSDEEVETLLVGEKLESVVRTLEDSERQLNQEWSYEPKKTHAKPRPKEQNLQSATNTKLTTHSPNAKEPTAIVPTVGRLSIKPSGSLPDSTKPTSLPGLGDNFWEFEKRFGAYIEKDVSQSDWTFARFPYDSSTSLIVGSRERSGTADLIVIEGRKGSNVSAVEAMAVAQSMIGKYRSYKPGAPLKSVRYFPSGDVEVVIKKSAAYQTICLTSRDNTERTVVLLTRLQQDPDKLIGALKGRTMFKKLLPCFSDQ